MDNIERLLKATVEELDRLLNAKNVLGAPIEKEGATVIPLVNYGFGFGAGGGTNQKSGQGGGTGAAGGIKPVGAIIIDKQGARVEGIKGGMRGLVEAIGEAAAGAMNRSSGREASKATE